MPLNIGLIGAGRMGSTLAHHLAFAVDSVNLVAIADPYEDNAREAAATGYHSKFCGPICLCRRNPGLCRFIVEDYSVPITGTRSLDEGRPVMVAETGM
jgi:predicted dinucleotide-binding enzyme